MEDTIQFIAKDGDWVVVRKTKPRENTDLENAFFLAGIIYSAEQRMEHYIRKALDITPLEEIVHEVTGKATEENISKILKQVSTKSSRIISKLIESSYPDLQKKEKEALKEMLKIYALRKAFESIGMKLDYSNVYELLSKSLKKLK